jgi:hypothetical protein
VKNQSVRLALFIVSMSIQLFIGHSLSLAQCRIFETFPVDLPNYQLPENWSACDPYPEHGWYIAGPSGTSYDNGSYSLRSQSIDEGEFGCAEWTVTVPDSVYETDAEPALEFWYKVANLTTDDRDQTFELYINNSLEDEWTEDTEDANGDIVWTHSDPYDLEVGANTIQFIHSSSPNGGTSGNVRIDALCVNWIVAPQEISHDAGACLQFDETSVGETDTVILSIENIGGRNLVINSITVPAFFARLFNGPVTLPPNSDPFEVAVVFRPLIEEDHFYTGNIVISSNDPVTPTTVIPVCEAFGDYSAPVLALDPDICLQFDTVEIDSIWQADLILTNDGGDTLVITQVQVPGGFTHNFSGPISLLPDASHDIVVTFHPVVERDSCYVGNVTVTSNDPAHPTKSVPVCEACSDYSPPEITLDPSDSLCFETIDVGGTTVADLSLTNDGGDTLVITQVQVPGGFTHNFSGPISLLPDASHDIVVTFHPVVERDSCYVGNVTVTSNDPAHPTKSVPVCEACSDYCPPALVFDPDDCLQFDTTEIGHTWPEDLTLTNEGCDTLVITQVQVPGGFTHNFSGPISLLPDASHEVVVTFHPVVERDSCYVGNVTVISNDPVHPSTSIPVCDACSDYCPPDLVWDPVDCLQFDTTEVGDTSFATIVVSNDGCDTLTISLIQLPEGFSSTTDVPFDLYEFEETEVEIAFSPEAVGTFGGTIVVEANDSLSPVALPICGAIATLTPPRLCHNVADSLWFDTVYTDTSFTRFVAIQNCGGHLLTVSSIQAPEGFTYEPESLTIPASSVDTLEVTFQPTTLGLYRGFLVLSSNDTMSPTLIRVSGIGEIRSEASHPSLPTNHEFLATYPNPFNPAIRIQVYLDVPSDLQVTLYDVLGREVESVATGKFESGVKVFNVDASRMSAGIYFVEARTPTSRRVQKIVKLP